MYPLGMKDNKQEFIIIKDPIYIVGQAGGA